MNCACIQSLLKSNYPFARILVVDNGSTDGSLEQLERTFRVPQVAFLRNEKNVGFAGAMNRGFQEALSLGAEMVYSVNNDTETDPTCLGFLVEALRRDPLAGVAGPSIMYYKNPDKVWQSGGSFNRWRAGVLVPGKNRRLQELPSETEHVSFLTGCAIVLTREVLERVGLLDTEYFFYGEDLDFDLRVLQSGMRLLYVPRAKVWHKIDDVSADRTFPLRSLIILRGVLHFCSEIDSADRIASTHSFCSWCCTPRFEFFKL